MWGSRPLPDAVTRSTGTGAVLPGSAARSAATRALTASCSAGFEGPRFEPDEAPPLYAGDVAEGRPQKYFGASNGCPMSLDPRGPLGASMRPPLACRGNAARATPVTSSG